MSEKEMIEKIRASYEVKEPTKLDELRELDKKVKNPAYAFAYGYGTVGALVLGTGMCLAMKVIGSSLAFAMPLGIVIGCAGIAICATTYPIFKKIYEKRKNKYSKQVFELSDTLLKN